MRPATGQARVACSALAAGLALVTLPACGATREHARQSSAVIHRQGRPSAPPSPRHEPPPTPAPPVVTVAPGAPWWQPYEGLPALERFEGRASYYADSLAGRHTANGDVYEPTELTAASRELPFGTILRVVRVQTGASVIVRVNDRGPFGDRRRVLDLSRAAAEALDMIRAGVADVRVEVLERPATGARRRR